MERLAGWIATTAMALSALCFGGFLLMVIAQVGYRYLGISMVFSEDAARLFNIYALFLGLVMIVHAGGDVRIDLIDRYLAPEGAARRGLAVFYALVQVLLLAAICYGSYELMRSNWGWTLPAISFLHQGHIYMAPFIGSALSLLVLALRLPARLSGRARSAEGDMR
ncbi:TRAP transporter small permease subunit [Salinisphaera sp. T31B1]|uniref:TRAP transporter small permease n=1 Tax=Salinisphaera sp. T31B1 TaxID=727963 RepID=UPI00334204DE